MQLLEVLPEVALQVEMKVVLVRQKEIMEVIQTTRSLSIYMVVAVELAVLVVTLLVMLVEMVEMG